MKTDIAILQKLFDLLKRPAVYHSVMWIGLLLVVSALQSYLQKPNFFYFLSSNVVIFVALGAAIYYNIYILVPKFLAHKKIWGYLGMLVLLVLIITPVETLLLYAKSEGFPEMRANLIISRNYAFLSNFIIIGTSTLVKITIDWLKSQREKQELQTQTMQSELRFLKSQINPHFLFNTLNSLYALTLKKSEKAPDIVLKLSEMMRYMLYECNEPKVPLSKEVSYIGNYLELEKLRQGDNIDIDYKVEGTITDQQIAPLMFIPFIENCFKHGLGNQLSHGFVRIYLKVLGDEVEARIENSKTQRMPKPLHPRSGGIGLVNVRRRLDLLYPEKYSLDVEDAPDKYVVLLKILLDR